MINRYQALSKSERRAFWIVVVMASAFAIFSATLIDTLLAAPTLQYFLANSLPFILTITAIASAFLFLAGWITAGSWLIQIGTIFGLLIAVTQAEGYSFPAAFIILAVTLYIPVQTLKGQAGFASLWVGIAVTLGVI